MKKHPKKFKVGLVQLAFSKNPDDNLKKAISWIEKASKKGAQVICLPELFRSQYFCQSENIDYYDLAETIPGPSTDAVSKIAKKLKVVVVVPLFEKRSTGLYHNSLAVINTKGEIAGVYRKMQNSSGLFYQQSHSFQEDKELSWIVVH